MTQWSSGWRSRSCSRGLSPGERTHSGPVYPEVTPDAWNYSRDQLVGTNPAVKGLDVTKVIDKDHHEMEMFEVQNGKEIKTMRLVYTRKK